MDGVAEAGEGDVERLSPDELQPAMLATTSIVIRVRVIVMPQVN
ncbi:hypothetical protein [Vibrio vulnificus YJ016]|uniref:Uncharacterized protein n=1 Tax=Vibrio vulnificus (strain YJ016) TaxID=196600 RepID=Q7MKT4_VIBVY|nr:hypothetical protein [Vibrio vulnificus YJ016]